jgi:hypothetical protein
MALNIEVIGSAQRFLSIHAAVNNRAENSHQAVRVAPHGGERPHHSRDRDHPT